MEVYKYPNIKTEDTLRLKVHIPSKGVIAIEGIGVLKSNLYPSEYELIGYIKHDSFIVLSLKKLENENLTYKKIDEFLREKSFRFEDYAISTALILNNRQFLPYEIRNAFAETGMYHLIAISGLHIGIIFAIISFFLSIFYIPRKLNFIISTIIIFFYVMLLDFIPSAFRAFLFALIFSIANLTERKVNMLNVWGLSFLINLLISPTQIYDIGFQLSYFAVLGIIYSPFKYSDNYILNILKSSISAQIFTTPILLYHFSKAPILYFFANIITIPIATILLINLMLCLLMPFLDQLWISLHLINLIFIKSITLLESINLPALKFTISSQSLIIFLVLNFLFLSIWRIKFSYLSLPKLLKKREV
ncbi:MAG: ComEC/Rec2 family competence protein [candidate division WOR-3 bacterium]